MVRAVHLSTNSGRSGHGLEKLLNHWVFSSPKMAMARKLFTLQDCPRFCSATLNQQKKTIPTGDLQKKQQFQLDSFFLSKKKAEVLSLANFLTRYQGHIHGCALHPWAHLSFMQLTSLAYLDLSISLLAKWVFPKNRDTPKWMVYNGNPY